MNLMRPLQIIFRDEEGIDDGGLSREFFRLITEKIFSPLYGLFVNCESSRAIWFNPAALIELDNAELELESSEIKIDDFKKVGILIGLSVLNS